jgi:hypothetical protein
MSTMMAGPKTSGVAESGYGVKIAGFFGPVRDFANNLRVVQDALKSPGLIATCEQEGYVTFLAVQNETALVFANESIAFYRRETDKFFAGLTAFLASIKAQHITSIAICGSGGSLCLSVVYNPTPGGSV